MPVATERRNRTRTRPPGLVYAELGPSNGGMMRDLCEEGFAVRAMMPLRVGDITPFTLQLDAIIRLEGQCQVVWVKEEGRLLGLRFIDNSSKIRGQIRSWLALPDEPLLTDNHVVEPHQPSTMDELREEMRSIGPREESPHEDLKILQPPLPIEPARSIPPAAIPLPAPALSVSETQSLSVPEPLPAVSEHVIPALPPLEPGKYLPPLETELGTVPNQHNEILGLSSLAQEAEAPYHFQSAPSLEPLSILEKRNIPRAEGPSWLDNFTLSTAIGIMLCIALLISGFVFHQELGQFLIWLGQKVSGTESVQPAPPADSQNSVPAASPAPVKENSSAQTPRQDSSAANPDAGKATAAPLAENLPRQNPATQTLANPQKQSQIPPTLTPMTQTNKPNPAPANSTPAASPSSVPTANTEAGYQEFQAARSILRSDTRETELPAAVRLLWASVEKGNTGAEVALAELYRTGRGVTKNCDQTRILLTAAANRGNSDAKHELANLSAKGCR